MLTVTKQQFSDSRDLDKGPWASIGASLDYNSIWSCLIRYIVLMNEQRSTMLSKNLKGRNIARHAEKGDRGLSYDHNWHYTKIRDTTNAIAVYLKTAKVIASRILCNISVQKSSSEEQFLESSDVTMS